MVASFVLRFNVQEYDAIKKLTVVKGFKRGEEILMFLSFNFFAKFVLSINALVLVCRDTMKTQPKYCPVFLLMTHENSKENSNNI